MIRYFGAGLAWLLVVTVPVLAQQNGNPYFIKNPNFQKKKEKPEQPAEKIKVTGKLVKYLTEDGKLTAAVEVRDEKRGFGIFFGTTWRIAPDGSWSSTRIYRNKPRTRGRGKLTTKEIVVLAQALAAADAISLRDSGRPVVNPHVVVVSFAGNTATLVFGVDQKLPSGGVGTEPAGTRGRFGAVISAVRGAIEPYIQGEPPLPPRLR